MESANRLGRRISCRGCLRFSRNTLKEILFFASTLAALSGLALAFICGGRALGFGLRLLLHRSKRWVDRFPYKTGAKDQTVIRSASYGPTGGAAPVDCVW